MKVYRFDFKKFLLILLLNIFTSMLFFACAPSNHEQSGLEGSSDKVVETLATNTTDDSNGTNEMEGTDKSNVTDEIEVIDETNLTDEMEITDESNDTNVVDETETIDNVVEIAEMDEPTNVNETSKDSFIKELKITPDIIVLDEVTEHTVCVEVEAGINYEIQFLEVDASGKTLANIVTLHDDGKIDEKANDGRYCNKFNISHEQEGVKYFAVEIPLLNKMSSIQEIHVVTMPSDQEFQEIYDANDKISEDYKILVSSGKTQAQALDIIEDDLKTMSQVDSSSIIRNNRSIEWVTESGIPVFLDAHRFNNALDELIENLKTKPVRNPAVHELQKKPDYQTPLCTDKWKAIGLAPYRDQIDPYDETLDILSKLNNVGYSTIHAIDQQVRIDDFARLGQYDVAVISTYGFVTNSAGSVMLTGSTKDQAIKEFGGKSIVHRMLKC